MNQLIESYRAGKLAAGLFALGDFCRVPRVITLAYAPRLVGMGVVAKAEH